MREPRRFPHGRTAKGGYSAYVDPEINRMVLEQLEIVPDVRMELVEPLRLAIEGNRYHVPEEEVAERMIRRCLSASMS